MYLTFSRYQELGGKLIESEFIRAEMLARMKIDALTYYRLTDFEAGDPVWEKVEFLVFELIVREYLGRLDGKDTTSESNDGRSVTWESKAEKADNLIELYLPFLFQQGGITQGRVLRV